jgi:hypothetical protein
MPGGRRQEVDDLPAKRDGPPCLRHHGAQAGHAGQRPLPATLPAAAPSVVAVQTGEIATVNGPSPKSTTRKSRHEDPPRL